MKTILALAQDPGGAEALEPVLTHLQARDDLKLHILARKHACSIFSATGFEIEACDAQGWDFPKWLDFAEDWLDRHRPDQLLTATSNSGLLERSFIRVAKRKDISTLTVIDFWSNYAKRFFVEGESQLSNDILPHEIATLDEFSAHEMRSFGFPAEILCVTGQPAFDKFVSWARSDRAIHAGQWVREELQLGEAEKLIVFYSQYISDMYPEGSPTYRGYTEYEVLSDLIAAASSIETPNFIAIKTHPKEAPDKFDAILGMAPSKIQLAAGLDADALIMAADIIIGMTSTAMVKGILAGRKVLSYQPDLCGRDELVLGRMGVLDTLKERDKLAERINRLNDGPSPMIAIQDFPETWLDGRAVERIVERLGLSN